MMILANQFNIKFDKRNIRVINVDNIEWSDPNVCIGHDALNRWKK